MAPRGSLAGSKWAPAAICISQNLRELLPPVPLGSGSSRLPEPGTLPQPPGRVGASPPAMPAKTPTPETVRQEKREQKFTFSHLASFVLS